MLRLRAALPDLPVLVARRGSLKMLLYEDEPPGESARPPGELEGEPVNTKSKSSPEGRPEVLLPALRVPRWGLEN